MNNKYKLTKNTKVWCGTTLYQIEATASFGSIVKGDLGGYIEAEKNLSVSGNAWVSGDARVSGKLKLLAGYFFGVRYNKEEIKYEKIDDNYELIYKGDAKFGTDETVETIEIGGIKYSKSEVEEKLKGIKAID